jgi:hypothetical protein
LRVAPRAAIEDLAEATWERNCFYASPIGDPGTKTRKHSDLLLESLVEPAISALDPKMGVIRSDQLPSSPITADVLEHVFRSGLMIADLSFHNPSVLYEVGLRHAGGRPCVLISREEDPVPANLKDVRIVKVHTSEVSEFWSSLEARRAEIVSHSNWALSSDGKGSNPVQRLLPNYRKYMR